MSFTVTSVCQFARRRGVAEEEVSSVMWSNVGSPHVDG